MSMRHFANSAVNNCNRIFSQQKPPKIHTQAANFIIGKRCLGIFKQCPLFY